MKHFQYIAILGRQPEFGMLELEAVFGAEAVKPFGRQAALVDGFLDIAKFGSVVKTAEVLKIVPAAEHRRALAEAADGLALGEGKTPFAFSSYMPGARREAVLAGGLELKKLLRARGSVRLVAPARGTSVSAAELAHNKVLEKGFELLLVVAGGEAVIARTTNVQDIDWYSKRDYGRPARSAKVGMLPPKLAQIMVNTAKSELVADPFCGTGVVLQEALLLGKECLGSDISEEMAAASRTNLEWLQGQVERKLPLWEVSKEDARAVTLPDGCSVVSEGYFGPNLERSPAPAELEKMRAELSVLYRATLANWAAQSAPGATVSLCVPAWRAGGRWHYLDIVDEVADLGYATRDFEHVRTPLLYAREGQVVGRQLLLLRKN